MSPKKNKRIPVLKLMGFILIFIIAGTWLVTWLTSSSLLYEFKAIEAPGAVVKARPHSDAAVLTFSVQYDQCPGVTETVTLGKKKLDAKAPKALVDIRSCLTGLKEGQKLNVNLSTRLSKFSDQKTWRIEQIGPCKMAHLPTRLNVTSQARCPWM